MAEPHFDGWYVREHPRVVSTLTAITGYPDVASDAADEAFVRAWERWERVRTMTSPGGWVHRTALNDARRRLRRAGQERRLLSRLARDRALASRVPAPDHCSPELWEALRTLSSREREAIALRYVADLPVTEVAQVMGVSRGTASWTLHAARDRLVRALGEGLAACSTGTQRELRQIHVQSSFINDVGHSGLYAAQENGLFRDVGLDVEVLPGGAGIDPVVTVANGATAFGQTTNASSVLIARSRGVPVKVVAVQYKRSPLGFLAKEETGIRSVADIRGKRVGVLQTSVSVLEAVLQINGLLGEVEQVIVDPASTLAVLLDDTVDVLVAFGLNQKLRMDLDGIDNVFFPFFDIGLRQESYPYFVSEETLQADPDLVRAFLGAAVEGWRYALDNPSKAAKVTVDKYLEGGDLAQQTEYAKRHREMIETPLMPENGLFYPDLTIWEDTNKVLFETGLIDRPVDLDALVTTDFL